MAGASSTYRVLLTWVGQADLNALEGRDAAGIGPIAQAVDALEFDEILLLSDWPVSVSDKFLMWLKGRTAAKVVLRKLKLTSPTNYGETYQAAIGAVDDVIEGRDGEVILTYHLSPGTRAMAAVWILIAKTHRAADLIESSVEHGVKTVDFPFDLSAEFIPTLLKSSDRSLMAFSIGAFEAPAEFASIIHRSAEMQRVIAQAARIAVRSIPVLIQGESGTGKEMLAQAIHQASRRANAPFVAVNCGAIPQDLVEAEFFGVAKGGYTDARDRAGHFEAANGGTLFLDEIGDLPLPAQVKLLRALEAGVVTRLGDSRSRKVDVRIIAATNRSLVTEVAKGRFREDLFYRLVVVVVQLPPLRERSGDIGFLVDHFLEKINLTLRDDPGWQDKNISSSARNIFLNHSWPGNIRELRNTLLRAAVFAPDRRIDEADARHAILTLPLADRTEVMNRDVTQGIDLREIIGQVANHYLSSALEAADGNMSKAAELVGLPSYQTFKNWLKKYKPS